MDYLVLVILILCLTVAGSAVNINFPRLAGTSLLVSWSSIGGVLLLVASILGSRIAYTPLLASLILATFSLSLIFLRMRGSLLEALKQSLQGMVLAFLYILFSGPKWSGASETYVKFGSDHGGYVQGALGLIWQSSPTTLEEAQLIGMKSKVLLEGDSRAIAYAMVSFADLFPSGVAASYQMMAALLFTAVGLPLVSLASKKWKKVVIVATLPLTQIFDFLVMGYFAKGVFLATLVSILAMLTHKRGPVFSAVALGGLLGASYGGLSALFILGIVLLSFGVVSGQSALVSVLSKRGLKTAITEILGFPWLNLAIITLSSILGTGWFSNTRLLGDISEAKVGVDAGFSRVQNATNLWDLSWWGGVQAPDELPTLTLALILVLVSGLAGYSSFRQESGSFLLWTASLLTLTLWFAPLPISAGTPLVSFGTTVILVYLATQSGNREVPFLAMIWGGILFFSIIRAFGDGASGELRQILNDPERRLYSEIIVLDSCEHPVAISNDVDRPIALHLHTMLEERDWANSLVSSQIVESELGWDRTWSPQRTTDSARDYSELSWDGSRYSCGK